MGTHTETYRRFTGKLVRLPLRFWPITLSGIRVATKRKIPLLLLFAIPVASMFIFSFMVYAKYAAQEGSFGRATGFEGATRAIVTGVSRSMQVKQQIATYNNWSRLFALLILAWFGSGLIADDLRNKAHLLYFSRPITKFDYAFGKFLTLMFFGVCAVVVPGLIICLTAVFASPEWSFLKEESGTILATVAYGLMFVTVLSLLVLAVSSCCKRKSFAMVAVFAVILVPQILGQILRMLFQSSWARAVSPWANFRRIGEWMFEMRREFYTWPVSWAFLVIGGFALLCVIVLWWRIHRLEVVG